MSKGFGNKAWQHIEIANSQLQRGQYTDALATLAKAEQLARKANAPDVLSAVLGATANVLQSKGMFDKSLKLYTAALNIQDGLAKKDSYFNKSVATMLNNLGALLSDMGRLEDAKKKYERALEMREALLETDPASSVYKSDVAMTLNNLGNLLKNMGRLEGAKKKYERALEMREAFLETDLGSSVYQSDVSMTLNNLGALLSNMGRPEDAKERYERALEMREALLETDPASSVYQSWVATTLNNLGALLSEMGDRKGALGCYQNSLGIYTEPMQYLTIKQKARAIINIIQLVSECAKESTNTAQKHVHFKTVYETYKQHDSFFSKYGLVDERRLAKEAGLGAHIQDLMDYARSEKDTGKRIEEYGKCIQEIEPIAEVEDDDELKTVWTSLLHYLKGLQFVNMAIQSKNPDIYLTKKAIEQFEQAKEGYERAKVCHCIYTVLIELSDVKVMDDKNVLRLKGLLKDARENLPENMDYTIKSAFTKIEELLDSNNTNNDSEILMRLYTCITDYIGSDALREHFNHTIHKIVTYNKELFIPSVSYRNWKVEITFDEPEKVQGKLTIKAGDKEIHNKIPLNPRIIPIGHVSEIKKEMLTFTDEKDRSIKREITYSEMIHSDDGPLEVYFLGHDSKGSSFDSKFNIAIVQLKYHLNKIDRVLVIDDNNDDVDNDPYFRKIKKIMHEIRGKVDLIVFPEFSIPSGYLPYMKKYSDETGIVIVAGSHYVTDDTRRKYDNIFEHEITGKDLRKNISPVIIPNSEKMHHIEKILGAKVERSLFFEEGMKHGSLNRIFRLNNDVTFGVMICFDLLNNELRTRVTDACNVILVPQTNPEPDRFYGAGQQEINSPAWTENKAYIMANGIFTYNDGTKENDGTKIMGGKSGVILTLDKDSNKSPEKPIIESVSVGERKVHEQAILLASLNMKFFAARDNSMGQVPLITQRIHIFEDDTMLKSAKDDQDQQAFFDLLKAIHSCDNEGELKRLLEDHGELIRTHSPLMHKHTRNLNNLELDEMKNKCAHIVV